MTAHRARPITLTAEQAERITSRAVARATGLAEDMADTCDPAAVRRQYAEIAPYIRLLEQLDRGVVTDVELVGALARELTGEALDAVAYERVALDRLRAGDMDYCGVGLTPQESERWMLEYVDRHEGEAVAAHQVLDLLDREEA